MEQYLEHHAVLEGELWLRSELQEELLPAGRLDQLGAFIPNPSLHFLLFCFCCSYGISTISTLPK